MYDMLSTELVFHDVMFPLNVVFPLKARSMEVTSEVSQYLIGPNIESEQIPSTGASLRHSVTAFSKSVFISTTSP